MLRIVPTLGRWRTPRVRWLCGNERGQGLAEYIIITIIVAVLLILGVRYFGGSLSEKFENATEEIAGLSGDSSKAVPTPSSSSSKSTETPDGGDSDDGFTESAEAPTKAGSGQGAGHDSSSGADGFEALQKSGVGIGDGEQEIEISEDLLWIFAGIVLIVGVYGISKVLKEKKKLAKKSGKKKGRKKRFSLKSKDESGQAMAEFTIVAITFLFTILGVIQLAMVLNAYSLVRYAAYNAARAAIVHNGDVNKMEDAARISLLATFPSHGRADTALGMSENYLAALATDSTPVFTYYFEPITEVSIVDNMSIASGEVVTFDDPINSNKAFITAQVVHRYELVIPLVNRIIFYVYKLWRENGSSGNVDVDQASAITDRLRRDGDFNDIEYRIPLVAHYTMRMQSDYEGP